MLIAGRRNCLQDVPQQQGARGIWNSTLGRIAGAVLLSLFMAASSAAPSSRRIEVKATRYSFEPAEITVKTGEPVDLVLMSSDVPHGLRIRELNINVKASKGKPGEAKFTPEAAGTFVGHCSVFCGAGHGKMTLTIHVGA